MQDPQIIEADWTWTGARFEQGIQVVISTDGCIQHVGALDAKPTCKLSHQALLPGMINAHSHAFQRGLRGLGETFPDHRGSFWSWRESMYELVERLDPNTFRCLCERAFREMLAAGITTVGEFHYLHHADKASQDFQFDTILLEAARQVGIRLVLLNACYNAGGIGQALNGAQKRFATPTTDAYWRQMDRLAACLDPHTQTLGVAAHSIRAAKLDDIVSLHEEARRRGLVFHMHVEEQRREIDECMQAYGKPPMRTLLDRLEIGANFTAIHGTHTDPADLASFLKAGGNVCLCPLTEANLGDGIADVPGIRAANGNICAGTDSNARICMTEELRWLEYVQRLRREHRGVCVDDAGRVANALWRIATLNGARSLGLRTGKIEPGYLADFIAVDLATPSLAGWNAETLLAGFILGTGNEAVVGTCVGGRWVYGRNAMLPSLGVSR